MTLTQLFQELFADYGDRMVKICAWCGHFMGSCDGGGIGGVTHDCCASCYQVISGESLGVSSPAVLTSQEIGVEPEQEGVGNDVA